MSDEVHDSPAPLEYQLAGHHSRGSGWEILVRTLLICAIVVGASNSVLYGGGAYEKFVTRNSIDDFREQFAFFSLGLLSGLMLIGGGIIGFKFQTGRWIGAVGAIALSALDVWLVVWRVRGSGFENREWFVLLDRECYCSILALLWILIIAGRRMKPGEEWFGPGVSRATTIQPITRSLFVVGFVFGVIWAAHAFHQISDDYSRLTVRSYRHDGRLFRSDSARLKFTAEVTLASGQAILILSSVLGLVGSRFAKAGVVMAVIVASASQIAWFALLPRSGFFWVYAELVVVAARMNVFAAVCCVMLTRRE